MKIAIHHRPGSFSEDWLAYCKAQNYDYKIVDCYSSTIIEEVKDCDIILWHWHHKHPRDFLFARQLLFSLQQSGKIVFPDINTCIYFDDKLGQKYILEALKIPFVPTHIFYDKREALSWAQVTSYPKVFKLRSGAGALNVRLITDFRAAKRVINRAFGSGFSQRSTWLHLKEKVWRLKKNGFLSGAVGILKTVGRAFFPTEFDRIAPLERGYVYFQDFIPNNDFDTRVIIVGQVGIAIRRFNRKGDFRASGSGVIDFDYKNIDRRCVKIAFEASLLLKTQCIAFDFVFDADNHPLIVETSFAFTHEVYKNCPGYWDNDLNWYEGKINIQYIMLENLVQEFKKRQAQLT